jgi:hypothetical protein
LRDKQEYLYATYGDQVFVPSNKLLELKTGLDDLVPLFDGQIDSPGILCVANKLLKHRKVVTERTALALKMEQSKTDHILNILGPNTETMERNARFEKNAMRNKFNGAYYASAAL